MNINMKPGKYVVAVSGGVDSVVLLDLLRLYPGLTLTVAHFDHGIRDDSEADRLYVQKLAQEYGVPFIYDKANLGMGASEAAARTARYDFLRRVKEVAGADAIVTAHHQDDQLETAVVNLLRGTGRKGLTSLKSTDEIVRPLLHVPKDELIRYARTHSLEWREDSTNNDTNYLRNHIRHVLLPKWTPEEKKRLLEIVRSMESVNAELDGILDESHQAEIDRNWFVLLPHNVAREVMAGWLRRQDINDFDRNTLERLTVAGKVAEAGKSIDVVKRRSMRVGKDYLALDT